MADVFEVIVEDFVQDLEAIRLLSSTFSGTNYSPRVRIAASNSSTLLVAATFEEFIREMARAYARTIVTAASSFEKLPKDLAGTAWRRTMDSLARLKFDGQGKGGEIFGVAQARFSVIYDFCRGDLSKDIYRDLIHNEMNMRPSQINSLFKISGIKDVCGHCSGKQRMLDAFGETEPGKAHGKLLSSLDDFFERRNEIAHALNAGKSNSVEQLHADIDMLINFGKSLSETLQHFAS